jgi:hypothetical protein
MAQKIRVGTWLSLVEHSVRDAGVGGSNPLVPTIGNNHSSRISVTSQPIRPSASRTSRA